MRILLTPVNQRFRLELPSRFVQMHLQWIGGDEGGWVISIAEDDGRPLVSNLPLVTGSDLLAQHRHLGLGARVVVASDRRVDDVPTLTNLGVDSFLYVVPDAA